MIKRSAASVNQNELRGARLSLFVTVSALRLFAVKEPGYMAALSRLGRIKTSYDYHKVVI